MILSKRITKENITTGSSASNKVEILHAITEKVESSPYLTKVSGDEILSSLKEREKLCSTGLGDGIAIPHCALDSADDFVVGFISLKKAVDFDSLDGNPVKLIFYIIGPKSKRNTHITLLSSISKLLKDKSNKARLLEADDPDQVIDILSSQGGEIEKDLPQKEKNFFHVIVQNENIFSEVLEILTSGEDNNVTVIEGNNASSYLHQLPLFSAYWTDEGSKFNRIITAVVDRHTSNDLIRRIKLIDEYNSDESGLLITVNELIYTEGNLDY